MAKMCVSSGFCSTEDMVPVDEGMPYPLYISMISAIKCVVCLALNTHSAPHAPTDQRRGS